MENAEVWRIGLVQHDAIANRRRGVYKRCALQ